MTERLADRSELFLRFSRRKLIATLIVILFLGAAGLAVVIAPGGPVWRSVSRFSLIPVAIATLLIIVISLRGRRWAPDSPEVRMAMQDEWRRINMDRASRLALMAVLLAQYPLAMLLGLGMADLPQPRPAFAMAFSTITIGLVTQIVLFLLFDRE